MISSRVLCAVLVVVLGQYAVPASAAGARTKTQRVRSAAVLTGTPSDCTTSKVAELTFLSPTAATTGQVFPMAAQLIRADGLPLAGRHVTWVVGAQTADTVTDARGIASLSHTLVEPPGTLAVSLDFAGDEEAKAAHATVGVRLARQETWLEYTGPLPGTSIPQPVRARLLDAETLAPIAGAPLRFQLGSSAAQATTGADGVASATLVLGPESLPDGATLAVTYDGDVRRTPARRDVPVSRDLLLRFGAVVTRHPLRLNGVTRIEGTIRVLTGEPFPLVGNATITGDLLLPGTPSVVRHGNPDVGSIVEGAGSRAPENYAVTLDGNVRIARIVTRTDPVPLTAVPPPPPPTGTRDVRINKAGQPLGDARSARDVTLAGNSGAVVLPPGTYGQLRAAGNGGFVLGVAGATTPAVYNVQGIDLKGRAALEVVGPVVVNVAGSTVFGGQAGSSANPLWLQLNCAAGPVVLEGGASLDGVVRAPSSAVSLGGNSTLRGVVIADSLDLAGGARVIGLPVSSRQDAAVITATQSSPAQVSPGESFDVSLTVTHRSGSAALGVSAEERLTGTEPSTMSAALGGLQAGASTTRAFRTAVAEGTRRGADEDPSMYLGRLALLDGRRLRADGIISFSSAGPQPEVPVDVHSASALRLPRLLLGFGGPSCTPPGQSLSYTIHVTNAGSAAAPSGELTLTLPDGTSTVRALDALAPGAAISISVPYQVPAIAPRGEGEAEADYQARLRAADGVALTARGTLTWKDARGNAYGALEREVVTIERVPRLTLEASFASALVPGQVAVTEAKVRNDGTGAATAVKVSIQHPDQSAAPSTLSSLSPGEEQTVSDLWPAPTVAARGAGESSANYQARLAAIDITPQPFEATLSWNDFNGGAYGPLRATARIPEPLPIATIALAAPETATAGETITYQLTLTNAGHAPTAALDVTLTLPDGATRALETADVLAPGERRVLSSSYVLPQGQGGVATVTASVRWRDAASNAFGPLDALASTRVNSGLRPVLVLAPAVAGPNITGSSQALTATLKTSAGAAIPNVTVTFTVTGSNARTATAVTGADGTATFTYSGATAGEDTIVASATAGGVAVSSSASRVSWVTPVQPVSTTALWGRFFYGNHTGVFSSTPANTPLFEQTFPTINFNPPAGTVPGNTSGVGVYTRPMADVTTDLNGNFTGVIVAQGNGFTAGAGALWDFDAVFSGELIVAAAGDITFTFFSDDGFTFGVGNGATRVGGSLRNPPASMRTPFHDFPVMGAYNAPTAPVANYVTVHFPAPGRYPYEVNYTECCGGEIAFTMATQAAGNHGVPPGGSLAISPSSVSAKPTGQPQAFTVRAVDASGAVQRGLTVALDIYGANAQQLFATTDDAGEAHFSYAGSNPGTDTLQALARVNGIAAYSGQVSVRWTSGGAPPDPSPSTPLAIPGWIASPKSESTLSTRVAVTLIPGITLAEGTLDYWPASDPSAPITLASGLTGGGTIATFDPTVLANGSYVLRLRGRSTGGETVFSGVLVTVAGDYKPGRVRFSMTDLTIPVGGMPIEVVRTYDSLERTRSGDFGYGWTLGFGNSRLTVNQAHDVTLTLPGGKRTTFYFRPRSYGGVLGFFLQPRYRAEPGAYGTLTADGCPILVASGGSYVCFLDNPMYQPSTYTYTDPYGRVYTIGADGRLRSARDINGDTLTIGPDGITSSNGDLRVRFERDGSGRITRILDPAGNAYTYGYDAQGDLSLVTYPKPDAASAAPTAKYYYAANLPHLYERAEDALGRSLSANTYYARPADPPELEGRLKSVTERLDENTTFTTRYVYDLTAKTVTKINPDGGKVVREYATTALQVDDAPYASTDLVRETVDVRRNAQGQVETSTRKFRYDAERRLTAVGLPDPATGAAAAFSSDPATCAARNICYAYDARGNLTSVTDALGRTRRTEYTEFNRPRRITESSGRARDLQYTPGGDIASVSDAEGLLGGYTYDARGVVASSYLGSNPARATTYARDAYGNVMSARDPLGNTTTFGDYTVFGSPRTISAQIDDGSGRTLTRATSRDFNALGAMTRTTLRDGSTTLLDARLAYDAVGNITSTQNSLSGWTTTFEYYANGSLKRAKPPGTAPVQYTYTWRGDVETMTAPDGSVTKYEYDLSGRQVSEIRGWAPGKAPTHTYQYDLAGRMVSQRDARGNTFSWQYDAGDRPIAVADPVDGAAKPLRTEYDADNRPQTWTTGEGVKVRMSYDARGFPTAVTSAYGTPSAQTFTQERDDRGKVVSRTDENGNITRYEYDDAGRLVSATTPGAEGPTRFIRDGNGQVRKLTDPAGRTTTFDYDALGRITRKVQPGATETFAYAYVQRVDNDPGHDQPVGTAAIAATARKRTAAARMAAAVTPGETLQRVAHTLADGHVNYSYLDANGNLVREVFFDGQTIEYIYSAAGLLTEVHDARGVTCYGYDGEQQVTSIELLGTGAGLSCGASPAQQRVSYTYDSDGRRTSIRVFDGSTTRVIGYAYDGLGRPCVVKPGSVPASCSDTAGAYTFRDESVGSGQVSRRITLTYPDGTTEEREVDLLGRVASMTQRRDGVTLASYAYTFDGAGRRTSVRELDGSMTEWAYTPDARLQRESRRSGAGEPVWDVTFTYDAAGNRLTSADAVSGDQVTYAYRPNGMNQLASVTRNGQTRAYTYDGRGNLTGDGVATYTYDARDQLAGIQAPGQQRGYAYDVLGNMVRETSGGATRRFLWDELSEYGDVLAELGSGGAEQGQYVLGESRLLEQRRGDAARYLLPDGQGSTRLMMEPGGASSERFAYDAFGSLRQTPASLPSGSSPLYTGQRYDFGTGLYYLRSRFYNPADGRFLTLDTVPSVPTEPRQLNRYTYGDNEPVNGADPSGHMFLEYVSTSGMSDEQLEEHEDFHAGIGPATGLDAVALRQESIFSALFDGFFVTTSWLAFSSIEFLMGKTMGWDLVVKRGSIQKFATMALGTVKHLGGSVRRPPMSLSKAININAAPSNGLCQWAGVARNIRCPLWPDLMGPMLSNFMASLLRAMILPFSPNSEVIALERQSQGDSVFDAQFTALTGEPWKQGHAEILVTRWALANFGLPPTPHRLLDVATTRLPCTRRQGGAMACVNVLPNLLRLETLLLESTIYLNLELFPPGYSWIEP